MKKFIIKTLGCKTNQIESDLIKQILLSKDFIESKSEKDTDLYILNSCSVTENADLEALKILKKIKTDNSKTFTILTGCFAQLQKENLQNNYFIDLILGNTEKLNIEKYLELNNKSEKTYVSDIFKQKEFIFKQVNNPTRTRACLKIQDGCNNECSYCTIRLARGKSRSANIADIISQVNIYINAGFQEIVLTGINVGQWGKDFSPQLKIIDLLKEIEKTTIRRYRLGSLNPLEMDENLLDFLAKSEKFCPHFHLSLQSACNKTLQNMNRLYKVENYLNLIDKINEKFKNPFIGSDIIVGFAGETDEDFQETYNNLEKSGLTQMHIFPFSARKNTKAAIMLNQVDINVKKQRAKILKNLAIKKHTDFINKNLNSIQEVLFEKMTDKTGLYKGLSRNYINISVNFDKNISNKIYKCKLLSFDGEMVYGEII